MTLSARNKLEGKVTELQLGPRAVCGAQPLRGSKNAPGYTPVQEDDGKPVARMIVYKAVGTR